MAINQNSLTEERKLDIRQRLQIPVGDKFDDEQFEVANAFMKRFSGEDPNPLKLLILGGPGSGKTWIINLCSRLTEGIFTYTTIGGSAASNLREGMTSCNAFGFVPGQRGKNAQQETEMDVLSETNQPVKLAELLARFNHPDSTHVFDEISQAPCLHMAHINNRCNEIKRDLNQVRCGDFNQIPGVGFSIPSMIEAMLIYPESIEEKHRLQVEAANDFMTYKLIRLTQQNRTQDVDHLNRIKRMVDYSQSKPISEEFIRYLQSIQLKHADIEDVSSPWICNATILVASNAERFHMNRLYGELYIKAKSKAGFYWSLKGVGTTGDSTSSGNEELSLAEIQALCQRYPELCGYFMEGAPATLVDNLKPSKGLSNGTQVFLNSLRFDSNHPKYEETKLLIDNAQPGDMVFLPLAPSVRTRYFNNRKKLILVTMLFNYPFLHYRI
jgi:hypothetical protein